MVEIKRVEWGIANSYPEENLIEIHKGLDDPEFENLKNRIIRHEMEHIRKKSKGFIAQRKVDFKKGLHFRDIFPFIKKYPKSLTQYIPITYSKKKNTIFIEFSLLFLYTIYAGVGTLIYFLIKLFSKDSTFFWIIIRNMVIILVIVFLIYFGGKRLFKYINEESTKEVTKK
ncbi:hypothetical protein LCGC14_1803520 [marine sediment metagenome]|uniref:Uncharacterized protein n=1 Tax=marine sediment metagenome TaxID=412755 RepID=A0A0F9JNK5_9ZZZZ